MFLGLKRKPTVIKLAGKYQKEKFENWAFTKDEPSKGINKAREAMHLAQRNMRTNNSPQKTRIGNKG